MKLSIFDPYIEMCEGYWVNVWMLLSVVQSTHIHREMGCKAFNGSQTRTMMFFPAEWNRQSDGQMRMCRKHDEKHSSRIVLALLTKSYPFPSRSDILFSSCTQYLSLSFSLCRSLVLSFSLSQSFHVILTFQHFPFIISVEDTDFFPFFNINHKFALQFSCPVCVIRVDCKKKHSYIERERVENWKSKGEKEKREATRSKKKKENEV